MKFNQRTVVLGLMMAVLLFGSLVAVHAQPPGGGGPAGPRQLLRSFFQAMGAADLMLLKNGAAISGTINGDEFSLTQADSGQLKTLTREDIASITVGSGADQVMLSDGTVLNGVLETDALAITSANGTELMVSKDEIALTIFKLDLPRPGSGQRPNQRLFSIFHGLQSQNIFGLFAQSLSTFDMAVFPGNAIWSGTVLNTEFVLNSNIFGTLTFTSDLVSSVEFAAEEGQSDFVSLNTGDRISGTLAEDSQIQFQPVGMVDENGAPVTLTLNRGDVIRVSFQQPASAFGSGGRGPGLGGGPGN